MHAAELFHQLAHETRLRLITLLLERELCVCELEEILDIRQANISKHLMKLKALNIVDVRREKQRGFYYLTDYFKQFPFLIEHLRSLALKETQLQTDLKNLTQHEHQKESKIYVCTMYKKETLS